MTSSPAKPCEMWRKARIAARILRRQLHGHFPVVDRDVLLAGVLAQDPSVTDRLISQADAWLQAHVRKATH